MAGPDDRLDVTVPEVRALATDFARDLDALARDMYDFIAARVPEASADEEVAGLTLASCASNVEAVLSMMRHGISATATEAPVAALEHARRMAARGVGIDATLRFYRLGLAYFFDRFNERLVDAVPERERLVVAIREVSAFAFAYIDKVSSRVSAELLAERERRQRRAAALRADVVRAVLAGEPVDQVAAERALGHQLRGPQLAFVCWTGADPAALERVATAVAQAIAAGRPLLLADGPRALAAWTVPRDGREPDPAVLTAAAAAGAPEVHVALGAVAWDLAGFRTTREQADRARRVAELAGWPPPTVTRYADIALVDLLSHDLAGARALVRAELGALADREPAATDLRATLRAVTAPHGGLAAAARQLGVHRNTVLQRVRRAEELRGRPITERADELHAALVLAEMLPEAVLDGS